MINYTKSRFLAAFFSKLNQYNVDYFVFGEYESLPDHTGNSDLDIIVSSAELINVKAIIKDLIDGSNVEIVSYYTNNHSVFFRFFSLLEDGGWGVQVDLFYKGFCHRGISYYPLANIVGDVVTYRGIKVLDLRKSYYIGFLKEIIHVGKAKEKYTVGFTNLVNSNPSYYKSELTKIYGPDFCAKVFNNTERLEDNFPFLQREMLKSVDGGSKIQKIKDRLSIVNRFFKTKPGYIIAFMGTDGSGKSTMINQISPLLNEGFHNSVFYRHLRPNMLPSIGSLFGTKERQGTPVTEPHAGGQSGLLGSILRWAYYMIDYTAGYFMNIFPKIRAKSHVYIFDRYYYDYYIDPKRARIKLPTWILRSGDIFVPQPDIIFCLGGDPEIIYKRKPETSLDEVQRQNEALQIFCKCNKKAVWVDTTVDPKLSQEMIMCSIIGMMKKRFINIL